MQMNNNSIVRNGKISISESKVETKRNGLGNSVKKEKIEVSKPTNLGQAQRNTASTLPYMKDLMDKGTIRGRESLATKTVHLKKKKKSVDEDVLQSLIDQDAMDELNRKKEKQKAENNLKVFEQKKAIQLKNIEKQTDKEKVG